MGFRDAQLYYEQLEKYENGELDEDGELVEKPKFHISNTGH